MTRRSEGRLSLSRVDPIGHVDEMGSNMRLNIRTTLCELGRRDSENTRETTRIPCIRFHFVNLTIRSDALFYGLHRLQREDLPGESTRMYIFGGNDIHRGESYVQMDHKVAIEGAVGVPRQRSCRWGLFERERDIYNDHVTHVNIWITLRCSSR